jgi:hypothetical protein
LAIVNGMVPAKNGEVTASIIPLARTPLGITLGASRQDVRISLAGLFEWIDRTFPADDELAFVSAIRDLELLTRIGWEARFPSQITEQNILNVEDIPEEIADALVRPAAALVQCTACRRLCVVDDFTWKEKQLCAWDHHAQVFGKRGPWHQGTYEERHFATLPSCAYIAPVLLAELRVDVVLTIGGLPDWASLKLVNTLLESEPAHAHMAVKTPTGVAVLRET